MGDEKMGSALDELVCALKTTDQVRIALAVCAVAECAAASAVTKAAKAQPKPAKLPKGGAR